MKKIILLAGVLLCSLHLFSQKISNIDFDALKKTLDASPTLYKDLMNRFVQSDSTLTGGDYSTLYYGQCLQESYNPYGSDMKNFDDFKKYYLEQDYAKALPYAMKMIEKDPMDIQMTFKALVCNHYLKDEASKAKMNTRYENLLLAILASGDGQSETTAYVVMRVRDEYELMGNMEVQNTMQSLVHGKAGPCDMMTLKPNDLGLEKLYFNVSRLFEFMQKKMKGN